MVFVSQRTRASATVSLPAVAVWMSACFETDAVRGVAPGRRTTMAMTANCRHSRRRASHRRHLGRPWIELHGAIGYPRKEFLRLPDIRQSRATIVQINAPIVQRTRHRFAEHNSLRQRSSLVRTAILQREYLILGVAKDRDHGAVVAIESPGTKYRYVAKLANPDVTHDLSQPVVTNTSSGAVGGTHSVCKPRQCCGYVIFTLFMPSPQWE